MKENKNTNNEEPVLSMIQKIKDGRLDPRTLGKELRQACVEVLWGEGYSISSMAEICRKSEKTIKRDMEEIREKNSLTPDIDLAKKIVGEAVMFCRLHRSHLMRLAREKGASVGERSQSEYFAGLLGIQLLGRLQSIGYLPEKAMEIHHFDEGSVSIVKGQLAEELRELQSIMNDLPGELPLDVEGKVEEVNPLEFLNYHPDEKTEEGSSDETTK